jgi:hypothetical protein
MIDPKTITEDANVIHLDFKLDDRQRSVLSAQVQQEGFDILQRLMIDVCRDFNTALMNTPASDKDAVLANHIAAKVAAQFYQGFIERVHRELELERYNAAKLGTPENPEIAPVAVDFL